MEKLQTIGEWLADNPDLDPFFLPKGERSFTEQGIHTVYFAGPMGKQDYLVLQVYSNGSYTILEHVS